MFRILRGRHEDLVKVASVIRRYLVLSTTPPKRFPSLTAGELKLFERRPAHALHALAILCIDV